MKKLTSICYHFLLSFNFIILSSCASSSNPEAPGFQKKYPWNFVPYTNAPWTSQVSFNDIVDLEPFFLQEEIRKNKTFQDKKYGIPVNAISDNSMLYY
jgi:hypothetical protein